MSYLYRAILALFICLFFNVSIYAHDRVVVIPMAGEESVAVLLTEWKEGVRYARDDVVYHNGSIYKATANNTSVIPPRPDDLHHSWKLLALKHDDSDTETNILTTLDVAVRGIPPDESKTVFITSKSYDGDLASAATALGNGTYTDGGLGADALCQDHANKAGLLGTYKAWISTLNTYPAKPGRFTQSTTPYVRVDGHIIADDWEDLIDFVTDFKRTLDVTELGAHIGVGVWTNTLRSGEYVGGGVEPTDRNCFNYTENGLRPPSYSFPYVGWTGLSMSTGDDWTNFKSQDCNKFQHLYCFQQ